VRVHQLAWPRLLARPWKIPAAAARLREIAREADAEILHADAPRNAHLAAIATRRPLVAHLRVATPDGLSDRLLAAETARMIAVSEAVARRFAAYLPRVRGKVRVVHNAVQTDRFRPLTQDEKAHARRDHGLPPDRPVVVLLGAFVRFKRQEWFLRRWPGIIKRAGSALLVMAGRDPEGRAAQIQRLAGDLGVADSVRILPFLHRPELLFGAADLAVVPSSDTREEGFPRVTIEAAACGLATVVTDGEGLREGVVHGRTGLLVGAEDGEGWQRSVAELLLHPARREAMGRAARAMAEERFSAEVHGEAVLGVYREILRP
jgi:glycosyltransferase involved in cell wall biosynthesis